MTVGVVFLDFSLILAIESKIAEMLKLNLITNPNKYICGNSNLYLMKKIVFILLATLPTFLIAQTTPAAGAEKPNRPAQGEMRPGGGGETIYAELIINKAPNGDNSIHADFGKDAISALSDKETLKQVGEIRSSNFTNVPDALNKMSVAGFRYQQNYTVQDKEGRNEIHMVFEKRVMSRPDAAKPNPSAKATPEAKPAKETPKLTPAPAKESGKGKEKK